MKFFESRPKPGQTTVRQCGFCRAVGHTVTNCPQVAKDWESWQNHTVPIHSKTVATAHWFKYPKYWGEWFTKCRDAIKAREWKATYGEKYKAKKSLEPRSCGFCGAAGHTRRNCAEMDAFLELCYEANYNWRKTAGTYLQHAGLTVGSAVKVLHKSPGSRYDAPKEEVIGLVSHSDWDRLSVCCAYNYAGWCDKDWMVYAETLEIVVSVKGMEHKLAFPGLFKQYHNKPDDSPLGKYFKSGTGWGTEFVSTLSPAPKLISEEWLNGYREAFQYLVKKRTFEYLKEIGFTKHIEAWAAREV